MLATTREKEFRNKTAIAGIGYSRSPGVPGGFTRKSGVSVTDSGRQGCGGRLQRCRPGPQRAGRRRVLRASGHCMAPYTADCLGRQNHQLGVQPGGRRHRLFHMLHYGGPGCLPRHLQLRPGLPGHERAHRATHGPVGRVDLQCRVGPEGRRSKAVHLPLWDGRGPSSVRYERSPLDGSVRASPAAIWPTIVSTPAPTPPRTPGP